MKDIGPTTKLTAEVVLSTQMAMSTTVNGKMIKHTATVSITILMAQSTKVTGLKISSMEKVKKSGQTTPVMKASTKKAKSTA